MPIGRQILTGDEALAAGERNAYVTIEALTVTKPNGYPIENWTTLAQVWMNRLDVRADERYRSAQDAAATETQWQMPYMEEMDPEVVDVPKDRRLVHRGRTFNILTASLRGERVGIEVITLAASKVA